MRFCSLGSGSSGNATLVEHCHSGVLTRVLLDCGMPLRHLSDRMTSRGLGIEQLDAVFVTHEHSDHVGCARQLIAQTKKPIWMSRGTYHAMGSPDFGTAVHFAKDGDAIQAGSLRLHPFSVPHDAKEPLQLVVASPNHRLGLLTDLGHVSPHVLSHLRGLDALILECNHDLSLLQSGKYPPFLKQRVGGDYGHLSNAQAAYCLAQIAHPRLQHLVAAHISEQNNVPEQVLRQLRDVWPCHSESITIAQAEFGFDWIELII